jgi:hypothetical protein
MADAPMSQALTAGCIASLQYLLRISKDDAEKARLVEMIADLEAAYAAKKRVNTT